ncbi:hypothetical protein SAMN02745148_01032 [Modicisalibacter ilicicola DSM 19980]|uniref:Ig-like domain-containing protein n=1 Tax=Modicisalibacter ilicicola DSM 19980 TaxID=1121942 RepID=A0A1M4W0N7_9GAMM|nr:hypothetical protein [Halomonas ilicicola]SHE74776.1 hypothetical protein SAMN02745148_01032 [Halomonas ilicicola DSM 19980]
MKAPHDLLLACLLTMLLALSPMAQAQYQDGDYGREPPSEPGGPPSHEPGDGGDGSDWRVPAAVAGVVALTLVGRWLYQRSQAANAPESNDDEVLERMRREGPEFAPRYHGSAFAAIGMVRGDWPFILDFTHDRPILLTLRLSARGVPDIYTLRIPFEEGETGTHRLQFRLPQAFGDREQPAAIGITATDMSGERTASSFRINALGCGPRAVGSVAIEEVAFLPRRIRPQAGEQAFFRFFSHSTFPQAVAEFLRVEPAADGEQYFFVDEELIPGGVAAGRSIDPRRWDGRDLDQRLSPGAHRLQVRAWAPTGGWVTAWSDNRVRVSP